MIDLGVLATSAIAAAIGYLGSKADQVVDAAAEAAGEKIVDWLKSKLTARSDQEVLEKLSANPRSEGARRQAEGALLSRLEEDPKLVEDLAALLGKAGATTIMTQNVSGKGHDVTQISGNHNTVGTSRRR